MHALAKTIRRATTATLRATPSPAPSPSSCLLAPRPSAKVRPFCAAGARLPTATMTPKKQQHPSLRRSLLVVAAAVAADASDVSSSPPVARGGPPPPRPGALPFDTPLAIALAGAAFEAYNSPAGFEKVDPASGKEFEAFTDADGTTTHYFDPKVLATASCGGVVASLKVSRAEGLPASDAWGTSDPYFVAELRGRAATHRSAVKPRTCSPTFDDEFELFVGRGGGGGVSDESGESKEDPLDAVLRISFFDSDALTADDALGSAEISLRELMEKQGEVELALAAADADAEGETKKSAGSVFVSGGVRTLSQAELSSRASGSIAPDGTDEVARMSRAWRSLARAAAGGGGAGVEEGEDASSIFEPAAFIENAASDTQLWIGMDGPTRRLMIAFRGTETTKILDVLTDLNATKAPLDARASPGEPGALPLPPYARVSPRTAAKGGPPLAPMDRDALWCHQGFLAAYRSVRCSVLRVVGECLAAAAEEKEADGSSNSAPWTILLTGHSLGGALSTLCAYELAHLELADAGENGIERLVVYNYGSPRVGSGAFASHFDASLPDAWRVVNAADLVPRVPRLLGYAHVGHAVPLRSDGTFDDEAIAENYAAGLYGDGDYVPVSESASSSSSAAASAKKQRPFASPSASSSEEIEPVFDEEGANVLTAATALAQAAASALFGGATKRKKEEEAADAAESNESGGSGENSSSGTGGYLTEKQAAADAVSKLVSSELRTMSDFLSGDAVSHHTEARYLEVLRKAVDAAGELARELAEEARGENVEGEVEAAAKKAAGAAQELIEEAQR